MARTQLTGLQTADGTIQRVDLDATTAGSAVIRKVIAGKNVSLRSTGPDAGTGDVTIDARLLGTGGRLTLTSGTPVTTADVIGATTIYYTPYLHNLISLWDGAYWQGTVFAETALPLGTVTAFTGYDVFGYLSAGALALEMLAWNNATVTMTIANPCVVTWTAHGLSNGDPVSFTTSGALPTGVSANTQYYVGNVTANTFLLTTSLNGGFVASSGVQSGTHTGWQSRARGTAVTLQDGRYCKSGDKTRLYLGSFFTTSTTTTEDSGGGSTSQVGGKRYLWNRYNDVQRLMSAYDGTSSWSYNGSATRQANAALGNKVQFFNGLVEKIATAQLTVLLLTNSVTAVVYVAPGLDSNTTFMTPQSGYYANFGASIYSDLASYTQFVPGLGFHEIYWNETAGGSAGTVTFYGGSNLSSLRVTVNA